MEQKQLRLSVMSLCMTSNKQIVFRIFVGGICKCNFLRQYLINEKKKTIGRLF